MSNLDPKNDSWRAQYEALTKQCGYVRLGGRTQIELTGADADPS